MSTMQWSNKLTQIDMIIFSDFILKPTFGCFFSIYPIFLDISQFLINKKVISFMKKMMISQLSHCRIRIIIQIKKQMLKDMQ